MALYAEAMSRFHEVYARAAASGERDHSAVNLATVAENGRPSSRVVLLKDADERGFVFYTNYNSRKGADLLAGSYAALCFFWDSLLVQVRVEGEVAPVSDAEADEYFASRERGSQIGAWASDQSATLAHRGDLIAMVKAMEARYAGQDVPRPPHWSGFRLAPDLIEFWVAGEFRLHERWVYELADGAWTKRMLNP